MPRIIIIVAFIALEPAKCERRGKRGEARIKRGGSGASRTGLSGAQGQTVKDKHKRRVTFVVAGGRTEEAVAATKLLVT